MDHGETAKNSKNNSADTAANTNNKKAPLDFAEEHFYEEHHHKHIDQDAEAIVVSPNELQTLEKGNLSEQQKKLLELLPNSPVIYMFDLKITDYKELYFNDDGKAVILENNISAGQVLHEAMKALFTKNYKECFTKMKLILRFDPGDVNAQFYSGLAAYLLGEYEEALSSFDKVISAENNVFRQEGLWFKANTLTALKRNDEAAKLYKEIAEGQGFYADKATALLPK